MFLFAQVRHCSVGGKSPGARATTNIPNLIQISFQNGRSDNKLISDDTISFRSWYECEIFKFRKVR